MSKKTNLAKEIYEMMGIPRSKQTKFLAERVGEKNVVLHITKGKGESMIDPWFGEFEGSEYAIVPASFFAMLLENYKIAQRENFELKLEKSIIRHIPIDFGDVWSVAIDELQKDNFSKISNLDLVIEKIKKEHPNLFVELPNLGDNKDA